MGWAITVRCTPATPFSIGMPKPSLLYGRSISRIIHLFCASTRWMSSNIPQQHGMSQSPEDPQIRLMFPWRRGFLLLRLI